MYWLPLREQDRKQFVSSVRMLETGMSSRVMSGVVEGEVTVCSFSGVVPERGGVRHVVECICWRGCAMWPRYVSAVTVLWWATKLAVRPGHVVKALRWMAASHVI